MRYGADRFRQEALSRAVAGCGGRDGTMLGVGSFTVLPPGTEEPAQAPSPETLLAAAGTGLVVVALAILGGRAARRKSGRLLDRMFIGPHTPGHSV